MSVVTSLNRAFTVLFVLYFALGAAQQCYFPDGSPSTDTPCTTGSGDSSCCGASAFCLDSGLCFGGGIVTRGSCTDKTWGSEACAGYCKTGNPGGPIAITPCSTMGGAATFVCGLNGTECLKDSNTFVISGSGSLVLRATQVQAMVEPILQSLGAGNATMGNCASAKEGLYTPGQMAGLGCALGIPMLIAVLTAIYLWQKERSGRPKLMYPLPDEDYKYPPVAHHATRPLSRRTSMNGGYARSEVGSFVTVSPSMFGRDTGREPPPPMPMQMPGYVDVSKNGTRVQEFAVPELDGQPVGSLFRFAPSTSGRVELSTRPSTNGRRPPVQVVRRI